MTIPQTGQTVLFDLPQATSKKPLIGNPRGSTSLLKKLRRRLIAAIDTTDSARDLATLSARLMEVTDRIESARQPAGDKEVTALHVLQGKRKERVARAADQG
jgi:hypothetical protein